jgi:hypothetical protein
MKHMLASITTKYSGPTGSTGSRINATLHLARDGSTVRARVSWDHGLGIEANHKQAAFAVLGKAGLIRGDYDLDGWSHDGVGHWSATPASAVTLTAAEAADHLDIIEQVAGYALEGWADALDRPDFDVWAKRYDDARHRLGATGSTTWFAE